MSNPSATTTGTHLWLVMFKAYQAMRALDLRSIEASGLTLTDFGILEILLHKGALPVNLIGEKILLTSGSITTAVDRLVKKGLVERQPSPTDRRVRLVNLTQTGQTLITPAFQHHQAALDQVSDILSAEEKAQLSSLLKKLGKHAQSLL